MRFDHGRAAAATDKPEVVRRAAATGPAERDCLTAKVRCTIGRRPIAADPDHGRAQRGSVAILRERQEATRPVDKWHASTCIVLLGHTFSAKDCPTPYSTVGARHESDAAPLLRFAPDSMQHDLLGGRVAAGLVYDAGLKLLPIATVTFVGCSGSASSPDSSSSCIVMELALGRS